MSNSILISVGAVIACALVAISKKDRKKWILNLMVSFIDSRL